jgi:two-component system, chemotaxis family, protein-glutamate methylesterase/glutaminase
VSDTKPATTLITIVGSAGAFQTLWQLFATLPRELKGAIAVTLHTGPGSTLADTLALRSHIPVQFARTDDVLCEGHAYVASPATHLVVNPDGRLTVSTADPVRRFRPSADWLFESAASSFGTRHLAIVLSGALSDGAHRLRAVKRTGGTVWAQLPGDAAFADMPRAAIATGCVDRVIATKAMCAAITEFVEKCSSSPTHTP